MLRAACHGTMYVSVFSGKIVSGINVVVRTVGMAKTMKTLPDHPGGNRTTTITNPGRQPAPNRS